MEELALKKVAETIGANCPLCGGSIEIEEGTTSVECRYCGSSLYLAEPVGLKNFISHAKVKEGTAKHSALKFILERSSGAIGGRETSILECRLVYVPFWRLHGKLIGWIAGEKNKKEVVEETVSGPQGATIKRYTMGTRKEKFSRFVFKDVDWSAPASYIPHLRMHGVSFKASVMKWRMLDHSMKADYSFALPTVSEEKAGEDAFKYLTGLTAPPGTSVKHQRFNMFDNNLSIYFYPIYFVRYSHRRRIYTISVDGTNGKVIGGEIPEIVRRPARNIVKIPLIAALLSVVFPPLPLLVLVFMYLYDSSSGERKSPVDWFMMRAAGWFGTEGGGSH